jgi:hypothetical protein
MSCFNCSCIQSFAHSCEEFASSVKQTFQDGMTAVEHAPAYWADQVEKAPAYWADQIKKAPNFWWGKISAAPAYWTDQMATVAMNCLMAANRAGGIDVPGLQQRVVKAETENAEVKAQYAALAEQRTAQSKAHHEGISCLEKQLNGLQKANDALRVQVEMLHKSGEEHGRKAADSEGAIGRLAQERGELLKLQANLLAESAVLAKENGEHRTHIGDLEKGLEQHRRLASDAQESVARLERENSELARAQQDLGTQISQLTDENGELKRTIAAAAQKKEHRHHHHSFRSSTERKDDPSDGAPSAFDTV